MHGNRHLNQNGFLPELMIVKQVMAQSYILVSTSEVDNAGSLIYHQALISQMCLSLPIAMGHPKKEGHRLLFLSILFVIMVIRHKHITTVNSNTHRKFVKSAGDTWLSIEHAYFLLLPK